MSAKAWSSNDIIYVPYCMYLYLSIVRGTYVNSALSGKVHEALQTRLWRHFSRLDVFKQTRKLPRRA